MLNNEVNKKKIKRIGITLTLAFAVLTTSIISRNFVKADENDKLGIARDVDLSIDNEGNLNIKRTELKSTPMGEDSWSLFIYMTGSDLESNYGNATKDIQEMFAANGINENVNIIIQTGGSGKWHLSDIEASELGRYRLNGDKLEKIESASIKSMGKSDTLYDFLEWGVTNYPAEHMGVVFWNHGSGVSKGLCIDTIFEDDALSLAEVEYAMTRLNDNVLTDRFELIGFDTCLSGSIEYANMLATYAKYMVASADVEPNDGWYYTDFIKYLNENPDADGASVGKVIVESYKEYFTGSKGECVTLATYDLFKTDEVCKEINKFAKQVYESYKKSGDISEILEIIGSPKIYTYGCMDLGSLVTNLEKANELSMYDVSALESSLDSLVVNNTIGGDYRKNGCNGITMFAPLSLMSLNDFNVCRNALVSPYWLTILEATTYYAMKNELKIYGKNISYTVNDWHNSEYYYEDNFEFLEYEDALKTDEQVYKLMKKNPNYEFASMWYKLFKSYNDAMTMDTVPPSPSFGGGFPGGFDNDFGMRQGTTSSNYTIQLEDTRNVKDVYNALYVKDGDDVVVLGKQVGPSFDSQTGDISSAGVKEWFALPDGQLLTTHVIERIELKKRKGGKEYIEQITIFGFPVVIDDVESTIRVKEIYDKDSKKYNYELLGVWDATDNSNYAPRGYLPLEIGTVVTPIYDIYNTKTCEYETSYGEEYEIESEFDFVLVDVDEEESYSGIIIDMLVGNDVRIR